MEAKVWVCRSDLLVPVGPRAARRRWGDAVVSCACSYPPEGTCEQSGPTPRSPMRAMVSPLCAWQALAEYPPPRGREQ